MIENMPQDQLPVAANPVPSQSKVWLPVVIALVAVALVSGGGVYLWQQSEIKQLQNNQPRQTGYINNQIVPTVEPTPTDTRALLTTTNATNQDCQEQLNTEPANTTAIYKNITKGLEMTIPYNKNWGSRKYRINPFEESKTGFSFGNISTVEVCTFVREYSVSYSEKRDKDVIKNQIAKDTGRTSNTTEEYLLNKMPVVVWHEDMACLTGAEFVGIKSNYVLYFNGSCDVQKDLKTLETLASLMKQI